MALNNGVAAAEKTVRVRLRRATVPASSGWIRLRYLTSDGNYVGEVDLFAISKEAAKAMINDMQEMTTGLILPA